MPGRIQRYADYAPSAHKASLIAAAFRPHAGPAHDPGQRRLTYCPSTSGAGTTTSLYSRPSRDASSA